MSTKHSSPGAVHQHSPKPTRPWPMNVGFWLLLGITAFFLMTEHHAHLVAGLWWLSVLLLLACPLIHMFGHGGHGGNRNHNPDTATDLPPVATGTDTPVDPEATRPHSHGGDLP